MTTFTNEELLGMVRENHAARDRGELPDEWYWAEEELMDRGYWVLKGELVEMWPGFKLKWGEKYAVLP